MKKTALAAFLVAMTPVASHADLLFTVGAKASVWSAEPTGQLDEGVSVDDKNDGLGLKSESGTQLTVFFEHPVPVIPNFRIRQTSLDITGSGNLDKEFNGFAYSEDVSSELDLSHTDFTAYWGAPLPVPYLDINFGLTVRAFDGSAIVEGETTGEREEVELDFALPMGFLEAQVGTPFGLYAQAEINYIAYDGNSLSDTMIGLGYDLPIPVVDVALDLGHRSISMKTNDDTTDIATDFEVSGMYYGASLAFGF
ncbi:MAG: TIGR04219 family outer membrane beta-barrel protein [Thalassolituus sp.]|jgi:outer membrane protein